MNTNLYVQVKHCNVMYCILCTHVRPLTIVNKCKYVYKVISMNIWCIHKITYSHIYKCIYIYITNHSYI